MKYNLTEDQQKIYENVIEDIKEVMNGDMFGEHSWVSIKGPAGTGKTWLSKAIVQKLLDMKLTIAVLAPTHQAVGVIKDNIGIENSKIVYATIHSFLGLKPGKINLETGEQKFTKNCPKKGNPLCKKKVDIVILDESSMVGYELFSFLKEEMYSRSRIKAFLFIGDACQLMPVEKEKDLKNYIHPIYDNDTINHNTLTKLIRNSDPEVIDFVTEIRKMIEENKTKSDLFNFLVQERDKEHNKIVFFNNKKDFIKDYIKKDRLKDTSGTLATFTNEKVQKYNKTLRDYFVKKKYGEIPEIVQEDLFVVQNTTEDFMNSEILELTRFDEQEYDVSGKTFKGFECMSTTGKIFNIISNESKPDFEKSCEMLRQHALREKNAQAWKSYFNFLNTFLDVRYHYSYTIHKLQGSSYEDIWVDCSGLGYVEDSMLLRLFYVACTRSRNAVHILI